METNEDYIVIQEILEGRETMLRKLYPEYRKSFLRWAHGQFPATDDSTLINAYQEAMTIVYENIIKKKLTEANLTVPLINYIIGIGNRQLLKTKSKDKKLTFPEDLSALVVKEIENFLDKIFEEELSDELKQKLGTAWQKLSPQCQRCLELFYTHDYKVGEIAEIMALKDENTVSAHKSRCLRRLRELIENL